jgi:hypothetical protein
MGGKRKAPRYLNEPAAKKTVRIGVDPTTYQQERPVWKIDWFDAEGPWGRHGMPEAQIWADIFPKLKNFESMTWAQIISNKHINHSVSAASLVKAARDRILALKLDIDELFRFRLTGVQRLWGIRDRSTFRILWWDPNHSICPSTLKHT